MKSTAEHPLAFFDWYLENEINKDLKEFYKHITEELYFNNVDKIDKTNHTIKVRNTLHDEVESEFITYSFHGSIKSKLSEEISQTRNLIELGFQTRFSNVEKVNAYADFLRIKLGSSFNKSICKEFTFLTSYFEQLNSLINQYSTTTNSSSRILSFYFDMLFINNIQSVKDSFLGNSTLQEKGYSYLQEYKYYMKEEMVEDNGTTPVFVTDIIKKEDFLERLINFENTSIYKTIEVKVSKIKTEKDKVTYLQKIYDDLQTLLQRVLKLENDEVRLIEDKLIEIVNNLKDRYSLIIKYHNIYKYLIKESDVTFFKNKHLKYSFYEDLYELAYELDLIDDTEIEEKDFINAFSSPKPQLEENKIRFSKNNYVVSYFLESLKPFFNGFTYIAIEKSGVFLNKQNKPIKSTDIYASLSRGKNKIEDEKSKIDTHILALKNKYLK
jgi:hypothetical protein